MKSSAPSSEPDGSQKKTSTSSSTPTWSGPDPHGLDPNWMPERAALRRKYGEERHLHFPKHLQPLAAAIDRLYFNPPLTPWEKEWAERARARKAAKRREKDAAED